MHEHRHVYMDVSSHVYRHAYMDVSRIVYRHVNIDVSRHVYIDVSRIVYGIGICPDTCCTPLERSPLRGCNEHWHAHTRAIGIPSAMPI